MEENPISRGMFEATVRANRRIGQRFFRLKLEFSGAGAKAFAQCRPGQFAQLDLSAAALPPASAIPQELTEAAGRKILLRRPFSFADVTTKGDKALAEILYCVVGPASLRMMELSAGNSLSVIGPLGNGFRIPAGKKTALLVAGGMGAGPLLHLAKVFAADYPQTQVSAFAGARTTSELPFEARLDEIARQLGFSVAEFAQYGIESQVATDDGTAGYHGLVTDCLTQHIAKSNLRSEEAIIFSCGPEAMLAKLAEIALAQRIDCQVSMERMMACGTGLCQSCAVECKAGPGESTYKLCCEDGPVFDSKELIFRS